MKWGRTVVFIINVLTNLSLYAIIKIQKKSRQRACRDKENQRAELSDRITLRFFDNLIKQKEENHDEKSRQNLQTHHSPHAPPRLSFIISRRYYLREYYLSLNVKTIVIF